MNTGRRPVPDSYRVTERPANGPGSAIPGPGPLDPGCSKTVDLVLGLLQTGHAEITDGVRTRLWPGPRCTGGPAVPERSESVGQRPREVQLAADPVHPHLPTADGAS